MQDNATTGQIRYSSLYRHGVDEKRRVQVPAKWRPTEEGVELTLIVWPKSEVAPCVRALPPAQAAKMLADIDAMPNTDPKKTVLKRFIGSSSVQATLDKSGRICLPEEMSRQVGITDQAVFVGLLDRFEIYSPEGYAKVQAADAAVAQEAFKLME